MAIYKPKKKTANGLEDILIPYSCIAGTPSLATVATSGSYNDLTNKPTIPTNYVTTDTTQTISGAKSFTSIPKLVQESSVLPNTYQEVEWLQSSGTQYIDTGVLGNTSSNLQVDVKFMPLATDICFVFGSISGTNERFGLVLANSKFDYAYRGDNQLTTGYSVGNSYVCSFKATTSEKSLTINGTTTTFTLTDLDTNLNMWLFSRNYNSESGQFFTGRIYYVDIYSNGTQIHNYIPCYRKSDGVIGMYDTINSEFKTNAGSGTFTKGADVVSESNFATIDDIPTATSELTNDSGFITKSVNDLTNYTKTSDLGLNAFTDTTIPTVTSTTVTDGTNTLDISGKQNTLTARDNITISNNVISALKYYKKADVTGVAGTSTSKVSTTYTVTDNTVTSYYDGMMVTFVLPVAGVGTYGSVFRINELDYKPIVFNVNSIISTRYSVGSQITMVYNSIQTATAYLTNNVASTITGCWQIMDYDATTTDARRLYDYYFRPYVGANKLYRYKLCALDKDNRLNPIAITNQESATQVAKTPTSVPLKIDSIWFYYSTSAINAGSAVTAKVLTSQGYFENVCQYNFNESIPAYRMIYLRGTYDHTTGLFTLYKDSSSPCTSYYTAVPCNTANITLSSYFTSGYYYWLVGATYGSADYLQLFAYNPLYYFDGTNLVNYTKPAIPSVNDGTLTIQKNGTNVATFSANQSGNVTANISVPSVENTVTSTSTANALSANMGKELQTQISNLQNIGRFLAIWDASTGTPTSEPTVSPYTYKVGDYYRVGIAGTKNPATNLTYVIGGTNYVEGGSLSIGDVVYCSNVTSSATTWAKQASMGGGTVQDVQVNGTSVLSGGVANIDISGKANLSGGNTFNGNQIINNDIAYKYTTTYYNCDSGYSSSKCFSLYQWDDKFQYTYRNASNNTYLGTAFEINATNGVTDYKSRPTVNGSGLALLSEIPSTSSFVPISRTIAGVDLTDNITANELQTALSVPTTYVSSVNGNSGAVTGVATLTGQQIFSNTVDGVTNQLRFHDSKWDIFTCVDTTDTTKKTAIAKGYVWCQDSDSIYSQFKTTGIYYGNDTLGYEGTLQFPTNISGTKTIATTSDIPTSVNGLSGGTISSQVQVNNSSDTPFYVNGNSSSGNFIGFKYNGTTKGYIGIDNSGNPIIYKSGNKKIVTEQNFSLSGTTLTITI